MRKASDWSGSHAADASIVTFSFPGKVGDNRSEHIHVVFADRIVGDPPTLPPGLQVSDDFIGFQVRPSGRQLLGDFAALISYDHPLHKGSYFEPTKSLLARHLFDKRDPLINARHPPARQVRWCCAAMSKGYSRKADDVSFPGC
jgi:hypothetical protein